LTIIGRKIPKLESWILSEENHPLAPDSAMTAAELSKMPEEEVRGILASAASRISGRGHKFKDSMHGVLIETGRPLNGSGSNKPNQLIVPEEQAAMIQPK
jgi:hypothetical protein